MGFMFGAKNGKIYNYIYVATIVIGAVSSVDFVFTLIDSSFALMAIPTMVSAIYLAAQGHQQLQRLLEGYKEEAFD